MSDHKRGRPPLDVLIRLVSNSGERGVCRGCRQSIVWMGTLNGKRMPMNSDAVPRQSAAGVDTYAASDSHWASCPARALFDKRTRSHA
jgi:hypothetical protein